MGSNRVRRAIVAGVIMLAVAGTAPARAAQSTASNPHVVPGRALVRVSGLNDALRLIADARASATVLRTIPAIGYQEIASPLSIAGLRAIYGYAEPVYRGSVALTPTDACVSSCQGLPSQWQLDMTNAPFAWDQFPGKTYTAASKPADVVTIAVLDTHIDPANPDFINAGGSSTDARDGGQLDLADARDWVDQSHWTGSAQYHGTFVAGLAAAATGNARDAAGLGYAARVMPLTVVDGGGNTDAAALA
ncbi:MAG: S8 family serine peptidase, partial [Actinobacteria bacterium]|nr:S8 family serine peptidase [Actinomycetota bacterium]